MLLLATLLMIQGPSTTLTDESPDPGAATGGTSSTAGVAYALAAAPDALYCVALNSGVWKAALGADAVPAGWVQLANSPRYAHCIAVDPTNPAHVVVGEREGDAVANDSERTGLWQSFDGGATFPHFVDPAANAPGARRSRAVRAIALTPKGTILVATANGLGRLKGRARALDHAHSPEADVQTVAIWRDWVFARTADTVHASRDDGATWSSHRIPARVGAFTVGNGSRGDVQALAGIGTADGKVFVYLPFKPREDNGNRNTLLILDVKADTWQAQQIDTGNGTGLGGRRQIHAWYVDKEGLGDRISERIQLVFCGGQDISQATAVGVDGTPEWRTIARTWAAGPGPDGKKDDVHSDVWAMHFDARGRALWLGTDGGVYGRDPFAADSAWVRHNAGLHTQHVHAIVAVPSRGQDLVAYATQDNDAWKRDEAGTWTQIGGLGDANWLAAVPGDPRFVLTGRHCQCVCLSAFATGATPGSKLGGLVLANDLTFGGMQCFCFEQPRRDEAASPAPGGATALLLARLPLQFRGKSGLTAVPGRLGTPTASGGPALLRNRSFATNPDLNVNKGEGWEVVCDDLPPDTRGFWAAGGTKDPSYFLFGEGGGSRRLYRRDAKSAWKPMPVAEVNPMAEYGPLFVNPYDSSELFVSTAAGVFASHDGGAKFALDKALTALASANGRYPAQGVFAGGNGRDVLHATQANPMCPLSCMAFLRDDPRIAVACSPFTGVFVRKAGGAWHDLSDHLPKPFTPVSSVAITPAAIHVATEGRGVLAIRDY
jgi:hypothetical protein